MIDEVWKVTDKYEFEEGMSEISGFGGAYEANCRKMLKAGLIFMDEHPDLNPHWKGYEGVFGLLKSKDRDAEKLDEVIIEASEGSPTGAMHQTVVQSLIWIKQNSWDAYVEKMKEEAEEG